MFIIIGSGFTASPTVCFYSIRNAQCFEDKNLLDCNHGFRFVVKTIS